MRVLIAEDGALQRRLLRESVMRLGNEAIMAENGVEALRALTQGPPVQMALLDWVMPGLEGIAVLRALRKDQSLPQPYVLLVTSRNGVGDVVEGLDVGADDYITKPYEKVELEARLRVGMRMVETRERLAEKVVELGQALDAVNKLEGLLPICMHCKSIRDDRRSWRRLEEYISEHSNARFSHGICEACISKHHP